MESGDDHCPTLDGRKRTSDCTGDAIRAPKRIAVSSGTGSTVVPVGAGLIDKAPASGSVVPGIEDIPGQLSSDGQLLWICIALAAVFLVVLLALLIAWRMRIRYSNEESAPVKEPWIVDLSERDLARIPENILTSSQHVTSLNISRNYGIQLAGDIGKFVNLTTLAANTCRIQSLPKEILRLQELQELHLKENILRDLPDWLTELKQLQKLNICNCDLSALPDAMEKMTTLLDLDLSANELKELPKCLTNLRQLTILKLSNCYLSSLPESMAKMTALQKLDLSFNKLSVLPMCLTELTQLTVLDLSGCGLSSLPDEMAKMTALQELDLDVNYLEVIPECLTDLSQLTKLTLRACELSSLPEAMRKMTSLRNLDLSDNYLSDLPKCLNELTQLLELDLHDNNLGELPECVTELAQLTKLTLRRCGLSSLPGAMAKMTALRELDLSANKELIVFPVCLTELAQLTKLTLIWCGLSSLPDEMEKMTALQRLDVTGNKLSSLPKTIGSLVQLDTLRCKGNMLVAYPEAVLNLKMLRELDFSYQGQLDTLISNDFCFIRYPEALFGPELPFEHSLSRQAKGGSENPFNAVPDNFVDSHPQLKKLNLAGNAMIRPPIEICAQGVDAIRRYLKAIQPGGENYSPYSICTLGETGVGKSSIVLSLKTGQPSTTSEANRTRVMDQETVVLNETAITVNDFGGHDIYQMVLPVFLPFQRLGILVYNTSEKWTEQEEQVRKWIATVIATSPGMHLIVVGTHADKPDKSQYEDFKKKMENHVKTHYNKAKEDLKGHIDKMQEPERADSRRQLETHLKSLKSSEQYVIITSCLKKSCTSELMGLKTLILKHVGPAVQMPNNWVRFMKEVLEFKGSSLCMSMEQANKLCVQCLGDDDTESLKKIRKEILTYLVDTSKIIWLADHPALENCIFHRFDGILDACKKILHHDEELGIPYADDVLQYKKGILTHDLLQKLLENYSDEEKFVFSQLMQKFSLVVKSKAGENEDEVMLIPCRFPDDEPSRELPTVKIQVKFLTEVIPLVFFEFSLASLLNYLYSKELAEPKTWKKGVVYGVNGIVLRYERVSNLVYVTATAPKLEDIKYLWKELHTLLVLICQNIRDFWLGAWPTFTFQCPFLIHKQDGAFHGRPSELDTVINPIEVPRKYHCSICDKDVPPFFMYYCTKGELNESDFDNVKTFLQQQRDAAVKKDASSTAQDTNAAQVRLVGSTCPAKSLEERFRKSLIEFEARLTEPAVRAIARSLFSSKDISYAEEEDILQEKCTRTEKVRTLLATILMKGESCILAFKESLEKQEDKPTKELARLLEG